MTNTIKLDYIAKIEGHAKLSIALDKNEVKNVKLEIYEGARFFEGLVKGMDVKRIPILTSRICGVCSISHQIAACMAIENAYNLKISEQTRILRKILLNASTIQSHAIHFFFMALPDYYSLNGAVELAKEKPEIIRLALRIKKIASEIHKVIGGREVHSVTIRVGKFKILPKQEEIDNLKTSLKSEIDEISKQFKIIFAELKNPNFNTDSGFMTLKERKDEEPAIQSSSDENFGIGEYAGKISYHIKNYSSSKFIDVDQKRIFTSALSRLNLNHSKIKGNAKEVMDSINIVFPSKNPFDNNFCQAIEIIQFIEECIELLELLDMKEERDVEFELNQDAKGISAIEVPRGILIHEYSIKKGIVDKCDIITPTTQNLQSIEDDIRKFLPQMISQGKNKDDIILFIERLIRAYDPCISCSTHFLEVKGL